LKDTVRGLLEPHTDADGIFEGWRKYSDSITSNHELYLYWKEVCQLKERQCLYIEKKSQLISLLNIAPKKVCVKVSQVVIQEVLVSAALQVFHNRMLKITLCNRTT
jgi:CDP-glycerol glycerophosphotransferase (TagB/SpsB family)